VTARWALGGFFVLRHAGLPFDWLEDLGLGDAGIAALDDERAPDAALLREEYELARRRLRERAADERVQEAVFLSSPDMYRNVWSHYVGRESVPDNARFRRVERQIYSYLQRLCAKNETTSFFGPIGYGQVTDDAGLRVVDARPQRRRTMLAYWAVRALARAVARDDEIGDDLPIVPSAVFTLADGTLQGPALGGRSVLLDPATAAVAERAWIGDETVESIASRLGRDRSEVRRAVGRLARVGAVSTEPAVPADGFELLGALRQSVGELPASAARSRWTAQLDRIDDLRSRFEAADFADRPTLLEKLEAAFEEATGSAAHRGAGEMYADRLMIVEEASSPFRLEVGSDVAATLERALAPGLELSSVHGDRVQFGYTRWAAALLERLGGDADLLTYATAAAADSAAEAGFAAADPLATALGAEPGKVAHDLAGEEPAAGARYALPDVCLAMPRPEDAGLGRATVVLSRVHHHLMIWSWLGAFVEPARMDEDARRWLASDPAARGLTGAELARRNKGFYSFPGPRVALTAIPGDGAEPAGKFRVLLEEGRPTLVDGDGRRRHLYLPLADLTDYPPLAALAAPMVCHAPIVGRDRHIGRITVGGAVYQRERWYLEADDLGPASGLQALRELRRLARREGLPRFTFVRSDVERKPCLIDAESPFAADLLQSLARRSKSLVFEEMLPGPEELWLRDGHGRYTCELRMQMTRAAEDV
jgi:Lantibiotic dehydratase, N terminus